MTRSRLDLGQPQVGPEDGRLLLVELADLHLDARRQRRRPACRAGRAVRAPRRPDRPRGGMSPSPMLSSTSTGFSVRKRKPRMRSARPRRQLEVADRLAGAEGGHDALQDGQLAVVGLALRRRAVVARRPQLLEALLDHPQVGQGELQVQALDVAPRVDRCRRDAARWDRRRRVPRGAARRRRAGAPAGRPGCRRRPRDPRPPMAGPAGRRTSRRPAPRAVGLKRAVRRVSRSSGTLTTPTLTVTPAEAARLGVAAGERVEDGGLARAGQADDGDLHRAVSTRRPGRPRCAAAHRPGSGAGCRRRARCSASSTRPLDHDVCGVTMQLGSP